MNTAEKFAILLREGLIQSHQRDDEVSISSRWLIRQSVAQKTAKEVEKASRTLRDGWRWARR